MAILRQDKTVSGLASDLEEERTLLNVAIPILWQVPSVEMEYKKQERVVITVVQIVTVYHERVRLTVVESYQILHVLQMEVIHMVHAVEAVVLEMVLKINMTVVVDMLEV